MEMEGAIRAVIAIAGEEGRFDDKGTSAYFRDVF